jgi:uncharacterized membrane protein (DUF2068 family)
MSNALEWLAQRKKALVGFAAPGVVLLVADVSDGTLPTRGEWVAIASACVLTAFGVHRIANKPKPRSHVVVTVNGNEIIKAVKGKGKP